MAMGAVLSDAQFWPATRLLTRTPLLADGASLKRHLSAAGSIIEAAIYSGAEAAYC